MLVALVAPLLLAVAILAPAVARAGVLSDLWASLTSVARADSTPAPEANLQKMTLLKPAQNVDPTAARGGGDIVIVDDSALMPEEGPAGTMADIEKPRNATISVYIVRSGDTLSGIAEMFGVSPNTILWANDLPRRATLRIGQSLTILPVTGVKYTVKSGDTLASIAKRFGANEEEILSFNGIEGTLVAGAEIIIPDGELPAAATASRPASARPIAQGTAAQIGYYMRPISGGTRTQGVHGYNAVDIAAPSGTAILASAGGEVIVARASGWNGGYGSYVVVQHANGSQTLYAHASKIIVSVGQTVQQGQVVGYVGRSGKATGPHVHFEIRNGVRNPF